MIKCLANKIIEFSNGTDKVRTAIGFCELPSWVENQNYFSLAVMDGSIKPFTGTSSAKQEDLIKETEEIDKLKFQQTELIEKMELMKETELQKIEMLKAEIIQLEAQKKEVVASKKK